MTIKIWPGSKGGVKVGFFVEVWKEMVRWERARGGESEKERGSAAEVISHLSLAERYALIM